MFKRTVTTGAMRAATISARSSLRHVPPCFKSQVHLSSRFRQFGMNNNNSSKSTPATPPSSKQQEEVPINKSKIVNTNSSNNDKSSSANNKSRGLSANTVILVYFGSVAVIAYCAMPFFEAIDALLNYETVTGTVTSFTVNETIADDPYHMMKRVCFEFEIPNNKKQNLEHYIKRHATSSTRSKVEAKKQHSNSKASEETKDTKKSDKQQESKEDSREAEGEEADTSNEETVNLEARDISDDKIDHSDRTKKHQKQRQQQQKDKTMKQKDTTTTVSHLGTTKTTTIIDPTSTTIKQQVCKSYTEWKFTQYFKSSPEYRVGQPVTVYLDKREGNVRNKRRTLHGTDYTGK